MTPERLNRVTRMVEFKTEQHAGAAIAIYAELWADSTWWRAHFDALCLGANIRRCMQLSSEPLLPPLPGSVTVWTKSAKCPTVEEIVEKFGRAMQVRYDKLLEETMKNIHAPMQVRYDKLYDNYFLCRVKHECDVDLAANPQQIT